MDLAAPPLVPLAVLALASSGQVGGPAAPVERQAVPAGVHAGRTAQGQPVSIRVLEGGRRAGWRIGYVARCDDGKVARGSYVSGGGTPVLAIGPDGRFRLTHAESARFSPGGTGSARFWLSGRLGRDGRGSGTWRVRLAPPRGASGRVTCTAGPLRWRIARG